MTRVTIPEIKPCPFCGFKNGYVERMEGVVHRVICNDCFAEGPPFERAYNGADEEERQQAGAIRNWNKRRA